ncbi:gloverin-like [Pararge aegeria]|uniref:Jg5509 protein n=1 Tax=Pararge aegeria aegeria TaxID=348720 RepID=A0A8S4SHL1_9NEOP|nr:gloverin-like [Pararge aegeria]CAH2268338.1 jg5509 [Pararge aegeria aegeria]
MKKCTIQVVNLRGRSFYFRIFLLTKSDRMQFLYILPAVFLVVVAQEYYEPQQVLDTYPEWYVQSHPRERRDVTYIKRTADGRFIGTLGENEAGLFGRGAYQHQIFNDNRGKMDAQVYGTRVLGSAGDSTHLGGALNWQNPNAAASLDISRQIHGGTSYQAAAGGKWPVGKNGDISVQGTYGRQHGLPHEYGAMANFNYKF